MGAPQVSSGEQLFLEQILRKNQCKNDLLLCTVMKMMDFQQENAKEVTVVKK